MKSESENRVGASSFNVLSLCSGVGGLDLGIKLAVPSSRTICYVEREAYCCELLAERMEDGCLDDAPIWTDLRTFDGNPWRGVVHCVSGGYPCQPFSLAGKRLGERDERHLWLEVARIVREIGPEYCFFENVGGHLSLGFEQVYNDLSAMGFIVAAGLFSSLEVGANQERERLYILGRSKYWYQVEDSFVVRRNGEIDSSSSQAGCIQNGKTGSEKTELVTGSSSLILPLPSVFPPSPEDRRGWEEVSANSPELEPAVCRVVDGMADWVDRLRAIGNGVVPAVVSLAWRTLFESLTSQ